MVRRSGECHLGASLVHVLAINDGWFWNESNHIVVSTTFNSQVERVGVHLHEVGSELCISRDGIDELGILRNLIAFSIRPVHEVVTEVFDGSQCDFRTSLVFLCGRIYIHRTSHFIVWSSSEGKGLNILHRSIDNT